jgi:MFS superfamily sulfate permease-like transporter
LGIAMASGFPPVAGVLTAIIGGVLVTFLGSARLTIKGPAAGLIVIAIGCVQELGQGDMVAGYKRALAVGVMAAVVQIIFSLVRAATIGVAMSPSVVHGMLAAIGVIIISKQAHTMMGVAPHAKEPLQLLAEIPHSLSVANPEIFSLGILALVILFGWPLIKSKFTKLIPAPIVVLLITVPLGLWYDLDHAHDYKLFAHDYHLGPEYLVRLPGSLIDAVAFPDFSMAFSATSLKYVVMFALVGTIESTLSVLAVDAMDPKKQASDLNRDLFALSVGNLVAASIGGLPMISEIVRSKANIDAGARSRWSNFFHGAFLLLFVALLPGMLGEIPLAALAAMLVYTGTRLASPSEFVHAKHLGFDQLALFLVTLVVTLASDLLIGVGVGLALKFVLHVVRGVPLGTLFRSKVAARKEDATFIVEIDGAATFMALLKVRTLLSQLPDDVREVRIDLSKSSLVDHTFLNRLEGMSQEWENAKLSLVGLEAFQAASPHPHSTRRRIPS